MKTTVIKITVLVFLLFFNAVIGWNPVKNLLLQSQEILRVESSILWSYSVGWLKHIWKCSSVGWSDCEADSGNLHRVSWEVMWKHTSRVLYLLCVGAGVTDTAWLRDVTWSADCVWGPTSCGATTTRGRRVWSHQAETGLFTYWLFQLHRVCCCPTRWRHCPSVLSTFVVNVWKVRSDKVQIWCVSR